MTQLSIGQLSKRFGAVDVLRDISLDVRPGEFVSLLGPSGCGKSTLLRILSGLEQADTGSIRLGVRELTGVAPSERDIAMVFQNFALYPQMTVRENIALPLRVRRLSRWRRMLRLGGAVAADIDAEVAAMARTLEIEPLLDRKPAALSGGQRQRVALGRALIRQSSLLLMDEPLSSLDARLRLQTRDEISQIQRQFGITTVFVTHDQAEAMAISDRIAVMLGGRIAQFAAPEEIYRAPASLAVAEFIGTTRLNRFETRVDQGGFLRLGPHALHRVAPELAGQDVTLAWRPEAFRLSGDGLPVLVRRLESHGADSFLHGECLGQPLVARLEPGPGLTAGETVRLEPRPEATLLFDAAGQSRPHAPAMALAHV
ncbi:ABC transporter ATP-binding protein [Rhodovarius crocodyli]|uniref:ABC transporter ATP-binding protein n=1 Tax=Rhodovarius crocodyli TaxID=1979269 RepID=A0A437M301_9PROT|nr:ABC transporter ATP-binding protein [Rhodovarius crocodyli]RVT92002.1 ABC transporter ATP-binding protein [Rhodovarius crocodyli]